MPGRTLYAEHHYAGGRYDRPDFARRRDVLRETIAAFIDRGPALRAKAAANLERWRAASTAEPLVAPQVWASDWGTAALKLTRAYGVRFAVLNMANAYVPGGAYVEGTAAQEENLFRRTDAHFHVPDAHLDADRYRPEMTALLSAKDGRVYLDTQTPRVCVRGEEDRTRRDLGYPWLADDEIFEFLELRAAAQDLRRRRAFDADEARRRIDAQLDTLIDARIRHVVLSAFGCGAFANPAIRVAQIYRAALATRRGAFDNVTFAIFHPGYGPDNHAAFAEVFARRTQSSRHSTTSNRRKR